jgi:dihydrofolate synthase / folylpolyglutamate synthase
MDEETAYQETLDYIYKFIDYSLQRAFRYAPEKFDLARMRNWAIQLGSPHLAYPVIHIAGTKGKGSVSALCASALRAAGYRVGVYTSPHLQDYAERIQVDGENIPHQDLIELVEELKPQIESTADITTFEITTGLAFLYFARQKVDVAVIEVGLGGRLDATNIVDPLVSVITSLSYDHMEILGDTLPQIAAEKAGIIKPGRPVVLAPQREEARQVVLKIAEERNAPVTEIGSDYLFSSLTNTLEGQSFVIWESNKQNLVDSNNTEDNIQRLEPISIPLLGRHQIENAAAAYAALLVCRRSGLLIDESDIRAGFGSVKWPGRFELLRKDPPVVVDSAHNRDSAEKLRDALNDYFPDRSLVMLIGASEDKDLEGIIGVLVSQASQVITTQSIHPRAADPARLAEIVHQFNKPARAVARVEDALEEALKAAGSTGVVVAAGSIFLAAGVRYAWQYLSNKEM